ncbi:hypothetical protein [Acidianus sp. RZ1]|uniref:hypothetical protein n=1 Tax=Acidianus sp. RZ1 TaxID=1540082 RepID=UPI001491C00F|nr:hypothetical protein [Acidianus sp. RZ1]NON63464.1 hypothetical protein [Acidianus sp. RZ1]
MRKVSFSVFWELYREIEKGTKVSIDEFSRDKKLNGEVRKAIIELYNEVIGFVEYKTGKKERDALVSLLEQGNITPILLQEMLDISRVIAKISEVEDDVLYGMLVRIMEDLEELYNAVS